MKFGLVSYTDPSKDADVARLEEDRSRTKAFPVLVAWLISMSSRRTQASSLASLTHRGSEVSQRVQCRWFQGTRDHHVTRMRMTGEWCSSHQFSQIPLGDIESFTTLWCYETMIWRWYITWIYIDSILVFCRFDCTGIYLYVSPVLRQLEWNSCLIHLKICFVLRVACAPSKAVSPMPPGLGP